MKNLNDQNGNQTRDLPACSTVPQPTQGIVISRSFSLENEEFEQTY
jgi:hypothetical protein